MSRYHYFGTCMSCDVGLAQQRGVLLFFSPNALCSVFANCLIRISKCYYTDQLQLWKIKFNLTSIIGSTYVLKSVDHLYYCKPHMPRITIIEAYIWLQVTLCKNCMHYLSIVPRKVLSKWYKLFKIALFTVSRDVKIIYILFSRSITCDQLQNVSACYKKIQSSWCY